MMSPGRTPAAGAAGRPFRATRPPWHRLLASVLRRTSRLSCRNLSSRTPHREHLIGWERTEVSALGPGGRLQPREPVAELGARVPQRLLAVEVEIAGKGGDGEQEIAEFLD